MASTDKVHLNLDTVERDPEAKFEVFAFNITDPETKTQRRIEIQDPAEIDYQDLLECDSPAEFLRFTMTQEDRDFLANVRGLKGWRFGKLLEAYLKHYKAAERVDETNRKRLGF